MTDARSVEGPQRSAARGGKRMPRKPMDGAGHGPIHQQMTLPPPPQMKWRRRRRGPREPRRERAARLDDLYRLPMPKLFTLAESEGVAEHSGMTHVQLIVSVVRRQIKRGEVVRGSGTLEVLPDGYGFLRSQAHNYLASPEDIYVSPSQIRRMGLRTGLVVEGPIRLPIEGQDNFALMQVETINSKPSEEATRRRDVRRLDADASQCSACARNDER